MPGQTLAGVNVEPLQLAALHCSVEFLHAPAPSQVLVLPQVVAEAVPPQLESVLFLAIGEQVPIPLRLHALQGAQLAVPQQTPSTQVNPMPLKQSSVELQLSPFPANVPQWPVCTSQTVPVLHWLSIVQVPQHVPPLHVYCPHVFVAGTGAVHVPAPSQVFALVCRDAVQVASAHLVPRAYFWQAPAPLHKPVLPQVVGSCFVQLFDGSLASGLTLLQVPARAAETLQDLHVPLQAVAQQTP